MIHHIELYVSDLERSLHFWDWLLVEELGYECYQSFSDGRSYLHGSTYLVFVQTTPDYLDPTYHRKRTGLNHLAFHARDREQIVRIRRELSDRGIHELYPERFPYAGGAQHYALFFEDPDRLKVELVAPE